MPELLVTGGSTVSVGPVSRYIAMLDDDGNDLLFLDNEGLSNIARLLGITLGHPDGRP
jgi:hypothetical protein